METNSVKISHKVKDVKIVSITELQANEYNPNKMPAAEMDLLKQCIIKYGFLFPIIVTWDEKSSKYQIIDGYHRYETLKRIGAEDVAIVDLQIPHHDAVQLTVLMNRIKGLHQVELMSDLVVRLEESGLTDFEICENLGMETEELIRLKQQLGIAHAFRNHNYTKSWTAE